MCSGLVVPGTRSSRAAARLIPGVHGGRRRMACSTSRPPSRTCSRSTARPAQIIWKTSVGSPRADHGHARRRARPGNGVLHLGREHRLRARPDDRGGRLEDAAAQRGAGRPVRRAPWPARSCTSTACLRRHAGQHVGARGHGYALDAATGEVVWTFWSCPGNGRVRQRHVGGHLMGESGGAVPWVHPAVRPRPRALYWAFGNPYPRTDGSTRAGTNLFANSLVALDAKTGTRRWHFQSVHHDLWDCDNAMAPLLPDLQIDGKTRKVVVYGSKAGMFYILDRVTGEPVQGVEERPGPAGPAAVHLADPAVPQRRPVRPRAVPQRRRRHQARALLPAGRDLHPHLGPRRPSSSPARSAAATGPTTRSARTPGTSTSATA